jgi:hypothetical protein
MKETIRTASVLEIYNQAIQEFQKQKKLLETELQIAKVKKASSKVGYSFGKIFTSVILIVSYLMVFGSFKRLFNSNEEMSDVLKSFIFFIITSVIVTYLAIRFGRNVNNNNKARDLRIILISSEIDKIDLEISERKMRIKSLLQAEEVIVAKDIKAAHQYADVELFSQDTVNLELEKVCPMCAETVKKAAKICRYCGNKFE